MRIIRYLDSKGNERYGAEQKDGVAIKLTGDLFSGLEPMNRRADDVEERLPAGDLTDRGCKGNSIGGAESNSAVGLARLGHYISQIDYPTSSNDNVYGNIDRVNGLTLGEIGPGAGQIALAPCGDERKIFPSGSKIMETITVGSASKMTKVVYDPKPRAYKAVRVWLSNGKRILGMWTGTKWWSTEGEVEPVKWELEERRQKTDKLRKSFLESKLEEPRFILGSRDQHALRRGFGRGEASRLNDRRAPLLDAFVRSVSSHVLSVTGLRSIRALKEIRKVMAKQVSA